MSFASSDAARVAPTIGLHNAMSLFNLKLAIIGLGYVGLPLSVELGKTGTVVGFDINQKRIDEIKAGHDFTLEIGPEELQAATVLYDLSTCCRRLIAVCACSPRQIC